MHKIILLLLILLLTTTYAGADKQFDIVSPEWAASHANDSNVRILDVRISISSYLSGHMLNAVHLADNTLRGPQNGVPVQYLPPQTMAFLLSSAGVKPSDTVVVYSDGEDVLGATMVAYVLEKLQHPDVKIVDGGWSVYSTAQPTTQKYPSYTPQSLPYSVNESISVDLDDIKQLIGKPDIKFVDARPYSAYSGESHSWMRNGHIPGAVNSDWHALMDPNNFHKFKSVDEMRSIIESKEIKPSDNIIVYCGTSREATLEYTVLKHILNYPNVRLYEGSWTQYCATDLPMETGGQK